MLLAALAILTAHAAPVQAVITTDPIAVDGVLDEPAWALAEPVTEFLRFIPSEGGAPPGSTEVRFLQDDTNLYIGVRVSAVAEPVRARYSPRESINEDDQVGVYLDTFRDRRSGYIFYFNPLGIQQDIRFSTGQWNMAWDTVIRSRGLVTTDGYEIEIAVPFRSLKYPAAAGAQEWGLLLTRKIPGEGAKYSYPRQERDHPQLFEQAATLVLTPPKRGSGLELMPTLTAIQSGERERRAAPMVWNGFDPWHEAVRPSLDLRFGITPNVGLAATANPDFSQVENDEIPVDLNQRFAWYFEEKRPFFLDGAEFFQDRHDLFYSRSIVEPLYGAKVTGKEGPVSIGVLHALDQSPLPTFNENPTPGFDEEDVEDRLASNVVARAALDAFDSGHVGVLIADKRILGDDLVQTASNDVASLEVYAPLGNRWTVSAGSTQTWTRKDGERGHWGQGNSLTLERAQGVGTGFAFEVVDITADARAETSYLTQSGISDVGSAVNHSFYFDGVLDAVVPWVAAEAIWERNGDYIFAAEAGTFFEFAGVYGIEAKVGHAWYGEEGEGVRGVYAQVNHYGQLGSAFTWAPAVYWGREMDYMGELEAADHFAAVLETSVLPTRHLRIDGIGEYESLVPESADPRQSGRARIRLNYQFTRAIGLRAIGEIAGGTEDESIARSSLLFTWLPHPGTAAWIGYAETTSLQPSARALDRTVFAKVSILARP